jgi:dolichyl-phosphate beta-glucosyltransferase
MQKTCIVIPCFNEAYRFRRKTFLDFAASHPEIYFFLVDDGSTDNTRDVLVELTNSNPQQFNFLSRPQNLGKGESVREAVLKSMEWQQFDYVGYFDADLATPLIEIEWLLHHMDQRPHPQMTFGSRKKNGTNIIERNMLRHLLGRVYAKFVTGSLGLEIHDTQCGAKIFTQSLALDLFREPFIDRWLFDVEIFCRLKKLQQRHPQPYKEVVLRQWTEMGHSRIRFIDLLSLPIKTARIFIKYL